MFPRLILGGYKVEQFWLTGITKNPNVIEKIGKKIAHRINLNFFHSEDSSNRCLKTRIYISDILYFLKLS